METNCYHIAPSVGIHAKVYLEKHDKKPPTNQLIGPCDDALSGTPNSDYRESTSPRTDTDSDESTLRATSSLIRSEDHIAGTRMTI